MKKKQRISSSTKITTTTTIKEFRDHHHPTTTTKSELEEQAAKDKLAKEQQMSESAMIVGPRKVSIPGHEQYSEDRYSGALQRSEKRLINLVKQDPGSVRQNS